MKQHIGPMFRTVVLICLLLFIYASASDDDYDAFPKCDLCDDEASIWTNEIIVKCQRAADFLIAVAYFSIPIEIICFVSCSNLPFKWVIIEFVAFIELCGITHFLSGWTYGLHTFNLMAALTFFKILTALVSCTTAITLVTVIPMLLKVKIREVMLQKKTWNLGREYVIMKNRNEASMQLRMITQEIRKSLDRHMIMHTTLVELSKALALQNCAVWMPNVDRTEMSLTHELYQRNIHFTIPITDPDVVRISRNNVVNLIDEDSALAAASRGNSGEAGPVAAIRILMRRDCHFQGGMPELMQAFYAILVLVLPGGEHRSWTFQEKGMIKVVAEEVAVALSHAAIVEESQLMREKLEEQNRDLQQAQKNAMMASEGIASFEKVISNEMRKPMHSIMGLISMIQVENLKSEQKVIVDSMLKTSNVLSNMINDGMDNWAKDDGTFPLEMRPFGLHTLIKEAACLAKSICLSRGFRFMLEVDKSLPDNVMGDERRVFQVILHMVGNLLDDHHGGGILLFRVLRELDGQGRIDQGRSTWRPSSSNRDIHVRFEIGINNIDSKLDSSVSSPQLRGRKDNDDRVRARLIFAIRRIVQLMQGNIWIVPDTQGFPQAMNLALRFQLSPQSVARPGECSELSNSNSLFRGLQVLLADNDDANRVVTEKLLQKLGCVVTSVSSGLECLAAIRPAGSSIQVILLDLHMPEVDGFEVAKRIRKLKGRKWPMIIALTASREKGLYQRCMKICINGVICKPFSLQGIASELQRIMEQGN